MALELSALKFSVDTTELDRAGKAIGELVTNVGKLDKAARTAAQTEAILARAAKDNAKANLDNAKAQDVRLKSTITADKADQQAAAAIEKKTKATERATVAAKRNVDMLQLQNDTYDFILEGFSKGDAKVLAMAKATGQLSDQLKQVLTDIRQFSKNTFDQTETGLDRMVKSAKEASTAQGFLNQGFNLTAKQAKELGNDLDRLNIRLQHQGKSYDEIVKAQAVYKQQFLEEAKAVNQANSALAAVEKQRKDVVTATNYLTQADQKMAAALNTSNSALDKAGTDSLVKYESALRKSGLAQDVIVAKLATYKSQLTQVTALEQKRREQHLARALSPQLTDIGVSLYSGQAPLTVLLQQGGQIADLLRLSGVEAQNFGKALRDAFASMLPVMATVAKGLSGFVFGLFYDAGKGITNFITNITGMSKVLQHVDDILYLVGGRAVWLSKVLATLGTVMAASFGVGVLAIVAGLASLAIGLKQVITENNELAKAFALSGGSIGLGHTQLIGYVKTLADSGATTRQATDALIAMAKAGNFTSSEIMLVSKSAIEMQKGFGIAIEDTVKQFAKLKEKPVEALLEIAKSTGMVGPEVIKMIQELERAGKSTEAASAAMKAYANVTKEQVSQMKENYNGFALFLIELGQKIKQFFSDSFKALFLASDPTEQLSKQLANTQKLINQYKSAAAYSPDNALGKNVKALEEQARMISSQISATVRLRAEEERRKTLNAENAKYEQATLKLRQDALDSIDKESRKTQTLADFRKTFVEDKLKDAAKEKAVDLDVLKRNTELISLLQKQADIEYKKMHKSEGSKSENYYATLMREATNNTIEATHATEELTKSEQKLLEVKADPRFEKLNAAQKADVVAKYEAAIAAEKQTALTEKLAEAEEHRLKLLGKSEGIGKQYYADMQKLEEFAKIAGWSREQIEELTRAVFKSTPAWKAYEKALEDVNNAARKFNEEIIASQEKTTGENRELDHRLNLLGRTTEEQRLLTIEYQRANKIREVDIRLAKQLRDIEAEIAKAKKKGLAQSDYQDLLDSQVKAQQAAAEEIRAINRETAVIYAEDLDKEIRAIKSGITDSIVTALFEGGKAGSKKLREVLLNTLRQKVTLVVDVAVNAFINSLVGGAANSLFGGGGGMGGLSGLSSLWDMVSGGLNIAAVFGQKIAMQMGGWLASFGMETASELIGQFGAGMMNTSSIGAFSQAFQAGGAQMAGAIAGSVLNGFAGYSISKLISGGYQVNKYIDKIAGVVSMIPGIGPIAGVVGGLINRLFGRKLKESGIEGTFGGETGFEGRTYQFYKGGLFRSNKTKYGELDEETRSNFAKSFFDMKDGVSEMAKMLGLGTESLEDFTYKFKVNLKGLSEEEATKKIQEQFKLMGEEMAKLVLETDEYSLAEETRMDTLIRLSATLSTVNTIFENMGMTMYDISLTGADAAYELSQLFGGLEQFTSVMSNYYDKFYSDSEKQILLQSQLDRAFKDLGVSVPKTRDEFRALIESQDLTTEEGRKLFAELMKLVDGFDALASQAEQLAEQIASTKFDLIQRLLIAEGKDREALLLRRQQEIEAVRKLDPELVKLLLRIYDLEDASAEAAEQERIRAEAEKARKDAIDKAYKALETAIKAEKDALNERISIVQENIRILDDLFKFLESSVNSLYGQVTSTAAMSYKNARQYITQSYNTVAAGGSISDPTKLKESVDTAMQGLNSGDFATKQDYDRERLRLAAQLAVLRDSTKKSLTNEEKIVIQLQDQVKRLDDTLAFWKKQIDIANGTYEATVSVSAAIQALATALGVGTTIEQPGGIGMKPPSDGKPAAGGPVFGGGGGSSKPVNSKYRQVVSLGTSIAYNAITDDALIARLDKLYPVYHAFDGTGDLVGLGNAFKDAGGTISDLSILSGFFANDWIKAFAAVGIPAFANGGYYSGGPAIVGENGPEMINFNRGGYVHTASETRGILSSGSDRVQRLEVAVASMSSQLSQIAENTKRSADTLRNVSQDGDSFSIGSSSFLEV